MQFVRTKLSGLVLIKPRVFQDERGFFFESYKENVYKDNGIVCDFVQDNVSRSCQGVLRGLHFQNPTPQAKLVTVLQGAVFDVAVDIRKDSKTFGQWFGAILSDENHHQLFIPEGFAHGFYVLSDVVDFAYKCSAYYTPQHEQGVVWNDSEIGIQWPLTGEPILSAKDQKYSSLSALPVDFLTFGSVLKSEKI